MLKSIMRVVNEPSHTGLGYTKVSFSMLFLLNVVSEVLHNPCIEDVCIEDVCTEEGLVKDYVEHSTNKSK